MSFPKVQIFLLAALISLPCALPAATVSFSQKTVSFPDGDFPFPTATADLNNDGREDLVSTVYPVETGGVGEFNVRLSTGGGTYAAPKLYTLPNGAGLSGMAAGDFNNDGRADLAVSGYNLIYVYANDGKGGLTLHGTIQATGLGGSTFPGDFNHDRLMDLAYVANGGLHILFGDGKGGFTPGPITPVNNDGEPLLVGDYDGDGIADIAWGDYVNDTTATVLYGDNTGHFVAKYVTVSERTVFSSGDVNSDGKTDLIGVPAADISSVGLTKKYFSIYYGNSARTFATHVTIPTKYCPIGVTPAAADIDGNGINDIVLSEANCDSYVIASYVDVLTRNSNASYNPEQTIYTANTQYGGIVYGPFVLRGDRNSKPDVAVGVCSDSECIGTTFAILLNTTSGSFPACAPPNAFEGINVCSPVIGSAAASPVAFHVGAAGQIPMRKVEVWVDGTKKVEQLDGFSRYSFLDKSISMTPGSHKVTIFAAGWDNWLEQKTFTLSVK
ncbi:MAG: FG-GAP repeat domain-containing protein [Acidobacteriaceae bacterium]